MKINGLAFYKMAVSAANNLDNNKIAVNNMNVFPVPDGDTGINMTLTVSTVSSTGSGWMIFWTELFTSSKPMKKISPATPRALKYSARAWPKG